MRWLFVLFFQIFLVSGVFSQVYLKPGIVAGPTFSWPQSDSDLRDGFFGVTRTAFQTGICNSLQAGDHFFSKLSVLYSMQGFAVRQTGIPEWRTDIRYRISRLEVPLVAGTSGFLGNLRHREYLGTALSLRFTETSKVIAGGDSLSAHVFKTNTPPANQTALLLLAGFEVGTTFKNDASIYFGGIFKWAPGKLFSGTFESNHFQNQGIRYNGTYAGLEITFYFPRYSYWFKREFTF